MISKIYKFDSQNLIYRAQISEIKNIEIIELNIKCYNIFELINEILQQNKSNTQDQILILVKYLLPRSDAYHYWSDEDFYEYKKTYEDTWGYKIIPIEHIIWPP
jgi:hypothetical protein